MPRTPATEPHEHQGVELIFIISGALLINVHDKTHELQTSDSMFFDSKFPHTYKCGGTERTNAIVVAASGCD